MRLDDPAEPVLLTTQQTAELLGVTRRSVATLCRSGEIRAVRLGPGGRWRIVRNHVEEIVQSKPKSGFWGVRDVNGAIGTEETIRRPEAQHRGI